MPYEDNDNVSDVTVLNTVVIEHMLQLPGLDKDMIVKVMCFIHY